MSEQVKCPNCNGTNIEPGTLHSTGAMHFRPEHAKFLKMKTANIEVHAGLCLDCGFVSLTADAARAKALTDQYEKLTAT
jgi:hypothetical protein